MSRILACLVLCLLLSSCGLEGPPQISRVDREEQKQTPRPPPPAPQPDPVPTYSNVFLAFKLDETDLDIVDVQILKGNPESVFQVRNHLGLYWKTYYDDIRFRMVLVGLEKTPVYVMFREGEISLSAWNEKAGAFNLVLVDLNVPKFNMNIGSQQIDIETFVNGKRQ